MVEMMGGESADVRRGKVGRIKGNTRSGSREIIGNKRRWRRSDKEK